MRTKLLVYILISMLVAVTTGCPRIHSPLQEELAHDVQERYKTLTPSALQALEELDADLERLVASERSDFEIYRETSENALVTADWAQVLRTINNLEKGFNDDARKKLDDEVANHTQERTKLQARSKELAASIKKMNEGLKKAEKGASVKEQLAEAKRVITETVTALNTTLANVKADPSSPLAERLSITVKGLSDFVAVIDDKPEETQRVYSLIVEALRLGRDVAALEREAVEQEISYRSNVIELINAQLQIMPLPNELDDVKKCFGPERYPGNELVQVRIARLAHEAGLGEELAAEETIKKYKAELAVGAAAAMQSSAPPAAPWVCNPKKNVSKAEELRYILAELARIQSISLTNDMRVKELELRRAAEKFRNAKLKDAIYERERMTFVSFGLVGVVRYAEGGLRSEDIANLINFGRMIAEVIIAGRI